MDAIAGLLEGVRARGAFLLRTVLDPPWAMRIEDEAPLTLAAALRGGAWIVPEVGPAVALAPGDVALVVGPGHYVVADEPGTEPTVVIHPGQVCTTLSGEELVLSRSLGTRTWGTAADGSTALLTGTYEGRSEVSRRLLDALPHVVVVRAGEGDPALVELLAAEVARDEPGQEAVLDRLLDLVLISVVRRWLAGAGDAAPAWWRADLDPVVGPALRLLHEDPAHAWTIAELARAVGVSRAAFARRFSEVVGEPPIAFLTGWRLALAADLLREPGTTIGSVARQVGYGSPFALSAAFKRVYGVSPHQHRSVAS
ncbi:AraC family transcriptional regulator [Aquihabitans sp. G128]|uniref:AraC family transcriptional regulator n=1 Tax=Aquihabitans sp. G128 TaxID=2849779 RepID=UPI001C2278ED|nr:AraC family transcriptional regulator [Aquihabitans sp. G128]QXC60001.1 AraC family transcriptional regulator [Aquihabitans sp. G128]